MEEKIKELLESALEVKVQIVDEEFKFVSSRRYYQSRFQKVRSH